MNLCVSAQPVDEFEPGEDPEASYSKGVCDGDGWRNLHYLHDQRCGVFQIWRCCRFLVLRSERFRIEIRLPRRKLNGR